MSVFITRGMKLSNPAGGLQIGIGADGASTPPVRIQVGLALYPLWLEIALIHLRQSQVARSSLTSEIATGGPDESKASHLEKEFFHGMQSMTATATAIESFYASVKDFATFPREELEAMKTNKTPRPDRIKETFRRVFRLSPVSTSQVDTILSTLYRFRDWSVHPPADQRDPIFHPELQAGVEWRFIAFSSSNAREALRICMLLLSKMCEKGAGSEGLLRTHCLQASQLLKPVMESWAKEFGPISDQTSNGMK